jgi:hypothetical protein
MAMKHIGALFTIFVVVLGLWGCSQEGNLVVKNECATEFQGNVDNHPVVIDKNMKFKTTVYIGKTLAVIGPKDINVVIRGGAWTKKDFTEEVPIKSGGTTVYRIVDDIGACDFKNAYNLSVNALSVKRCDSTHFQPNLLDKNQKLSPGDRKLIQLDAGCWDILVDYGREDSLVTVAGVQIRIGEVDTIKWVPGIGATIAALPGIRP